MNNEMNTILFVIYAFFEVHIAFFLNFKVTFYDVAF
jgi:hypothetical protein